MPLQEVLSPLSHLLNPLINNFYIHIEMVIFGIYCTKYNTLLKLIWLTSFHTLSVATREFLSTRRAVCIILHCTSIDHHKAGPQHGFFLSKACHHHGTLMFSVPAYVPLTDLPMPQLFLRAKVPASTLRYCLRNKQSTCGGTRLRPKCGFMSRLLYQNPLLNANSKL